MRHVAEPCNWEVVVAGENLLYVIASGAQHEPGSGTF